MNRKTVNRLMGVVLGGVGLALAAIPAAGQSKVATKPAEEAAPKPIQVQETDTDTDGVVAELMECKRKEGVLSIRLRFRNTTSTPASIEILSYGKGYDNIYIVADNTKYLILRDEAGNWAAPPTDPVGNLHPTLQKGKSFILWAKYPAPPSEVKKLTLFTTVTAPFDDVPITDVE